MIQLGNYKFQQPTVLAPMAGITDAPFRNICRRFGAAAATAEMVTSDSRLWHSRKSSSRLPNPSWPEPRIVQIAGSEPAQMADAARRCEAAGAQIIDINMGCPAKKVCRRAAGSALLQNEQLVADILHRVTMATSIPVTLKIRTGWSPQCRNATTIAAIAEDAGVQALAIHGRTRACRFRGAAEYDTIAEVVRKVAMPVFANGDINSALQAQTVLNHTGAAGLMIGRGAQGRPWLFREINHLLATGQSLPPPSTSEVRDCILAHLLEISRHYDGPQTVRLSRKHVTAYLSKLGYPRQTISTFNTLTEISAQRHFIEAFVSVPDNNSWGQAA